MPDTLPAPAITEKLALGQPVLFSATFSRHACGAKRLWLRVPRPEQRGIVVGTRTLWDGDVHTEYFDLEDGGGYSSTFIQDSHKPALLVAFALNRKPVLVPLADAVAA